jgi:hypothetical protein
VVISFYKYFVVLCALAPLWQKIIRGLKSKTQSSSSFGGIKGGVTCQKNISEEK